MNPNHPHYAGLGGGGPNLNLLDNMLMAAGFQATDQPIVPRPSIVPQYTYAQDVSMHQQALNLGQTQTTAASSDPVHVIVYQQNEHQQQPISYKIPQLGTVVAPQEQNFVVNDQGGQITREEPVTTTQPNSRVSEVQNTTTAQTTPRHVQSPAERRKDIVAQAMQEQKIFDENMPKMEPIVKQEPGVSGTDTSAVTTATETKPLVTATKSAPTTTTTTQRRPYQRSSTYNRQQVMPRLSILDDEDDGLTCRLCLASYWYKAEIHEHLKTVHSIADPEKYDKEEKEKKMRRMREEQQRIMLAKKQREERERRMRGGYGGRGRGNTPGTIKLTSPGARPSQTPGQRPSFQYRDGAFICDLCKESFSDGNDMVTHWKSHVKKQQADAARSGRGRPRGRPPTRGRGRPAYDSRNDSSEEETDSTSDDEPVNVSRKGKGGKGMPRWTAYLLWSTRKRRDVVVDHPDWSFAQIAKWISDEWKKIDAGEKDELQKEAEEMNELGIRKLPRDDDGPDIEKDTTDEDSDFEEGYRKKTKPIMLKIKKEKGAGDDGNSSDESDWEPEADIQPPEREQTRSGRQRKRPSFFQEFESQENNLDSILEQFEREQAQEFGKPRVPKPEKPPGEKKPRKPRKRKEPTIDPEQLLEETAEVETLRSGRKRKVRRTMTHFIEGSDEDDKLGNGASSDDDDFEPPPEEEIEKIEENDDQIDVDDDEVDSEDLDDDDDEDDPRNRYSYDNLPPKKRGRPHKKLLTDAEIEEATKAAKGSKPAIEIIPLPKENGESKTADEGSTDKAEGEADGKETSDSAQEKGESADSGEAGADAAADIPEAEKEKGEAGTEGDTAAEGQVPGEGDAELPDSKNNETESAKTSAQESDSFKVKPPWVKETLSDSEGEEGTAGETTETIPDVNLDTPLPPGPDPSDSLDAAPGGGDDADSAVLAPFAGSDVTTGVEVGGADPFQADALIGSEMEGVEEAVTGSAGSADQVLQPALDDQALGDAVAGGPATAPSEDDTVPLASIATPVSEQLELGAEPAPALTEEDLLTGPAHNLDDSQFKPEMVDPNLDDIFK